MIILEELKNIKSGKAKLREFGLTIGIIFIGIFLVFKFLFKKDISINLLAIGSFLILSGLTFPIILKPFQKVWMGFSVIVGFFMSRVILTILFFIAVTPIGLLMRLFGKDLLDQKIDKNKDSYWHDPDNVVKSKQSYENQF